MEAAIAALTMACRSETAQRRDRARTEGPDADAITEKIRSAPMSYPSSMIARPRAVPLAVPLTLYSRDGCAGLGGGSMA